MRDGMRRLPTSDRWTSRPARVIVVLTAAILFVGCTTLRRDLRGPADAVALLLVGVLVGVLVRVLADRLRAHAAPSAARVPQARHAVDAYDDLIQSLTVAKWSLESGQAERALGIMTEAVERGRREQPALAREAGLEGTWTSTGLS